MSTRADEPRCEQSERASLYALRALPASEAAALEAHLSGCLECRRQIETLRPIVSAFAYWPTDVLRPPDLWARLAGRIAEETGEEPLPPSTLSGPGPEWEEVAPGIACKLLATDPERDRVSMLVRLAPGADYPPHRHADVEELHLLSGELWIEDRKLHAGDYNRAEAGSSDQRVWSETGCTCVLITSLRDTIF
jgi:hypothetical protein